MNNLLFPAACSTSSSSVVSTIRDGCRSNVVWCSLLSNSCSKHLHELHDTWLFIVATSKIPNKAKNYSICIFPVCIIENHLCLHMYIWLHRVKSHDLFGDIQCIKKTQTRYRLTNAIAMITIITGTNHYPAALSEKGNKYSSNAQWIQLDRYSDNKILFNVTKS